MGSTIFSLTFLVMAIIFVASTIKIVPQGYQFTVERFVFLADGLELVITPDQARLSPEQLRALIRAVLEALAAVSAGAPAASTEE